MKHRAGYTMIEMLCILALVAMLTAIFGQFFVQGIRATQLAHARADVSRQLLWMSEFWQGTLAETDPADWVCDDHRFSAGPLRMDYAAHGIEVRNGDVSGKVMLTGPMEARFSIERSGDRPACAVLELTWTYERQDSLKTDRARIVACGGGQP